MTWIPIWPLHDLPLAFSWPWVSFHLCSLLDLSIVTLTSIWPLLNRYPQEPHSYLNFIWLYWHFDHYLDWFSSRPLDEPYINDLDFHGPLLLFCNIRIRVTYNFDIIRISWSWLDLRHLDLLADLHVTLTWRNYYVLATFWPVALDSHSKVSCLLISVTPRP